MTSSEFRAELKKGLSGGYLFLGSEAYLRRHSLNEAAAAIAGGDAGIFNHTILSGSVEPERGGYSPTALAAAFSAYPMMAEQKLVQLTDVPVASMREADFNALVSVISELPKYPACVFIFTTTPDELDIGTRNRPSAKFTALSKLLKPVHFELESPRRLASWLARHFKAHGVAISSELCHALIDYSGRDMFTLSGEVEKLCAYVKSHDRDALKAEDIPLVACKNEVIDAFDFSNALLAGETGRAAAILCDLRQKKERPEIILASISRVYCDMLTVKINAESGASRQEIARRLKMHEYKVGLYLKAIRGTSSAALSNAVEEIAAADIKIKSTALYDYTVLDILLYKLADTVARRQA